MTRRTRLIILSICAILFLIITPYILLYSLGYRIDFKNKKIVSTGGIYVRAEPNPVEILIDSKVAGKAGLFSNAVFVQNLLPKQHAVIIKKEGYFDYQKNLEVTKREVAKLEHVILFKKNIQFEVLDDIEKSPFKKEAVQDIYTIKNNSLYYSDSKANGNLSKIQKTTPLIKNLAAYRVGGDDIIWLGLDGFLYKSNINSLPLEPTITTEPLNLIKLTINKKIAYEIFLFHEFIFLKDKSNVLLLDSKTKSFQNFHNPIKSIVLSLNGQKAIFYDDNEVSYLTLLDGVPKKTLLNRFSEDVSNVQWVNDDYIIFTLGGKIVISELDGREPNIISLPQTITVKGTPTDIKDTQIAFSQEEKKLYIHTESNVLVSERLIP